MHLEKYPIISNNLDKLRASNFGLDTCIMSINNLKNNISELASLDSSAYTSFIDQFSDTVDDLKKLMSSVDEWRDNVTETMRLYLQIYGDGEIAAKDLERFSIDYNYKVQYGDGISSEYLVKELTYMMGIGMFGNDLESAKEMFIKAGYNESLFESIYQNLLDNKDASIPIIGAKNTSIPFMPFQSIDDVKIYNNDILEQIHVQSVVNNSDYFNDLSGNFPARNPVSGENILYVYNYLTKNFGFTEKGAKALIANMFEESNMIPSTKNKIGAYGICQWLDRKQNLIEFANGKELDVTKIDTQLEFMYHELSGKWNDNRGLFNDLKGETDISLDNLIVKICQIYEIPSNDPSIAKKIGNERVNSEKTTEALKLIDSYLSSNNKMSNVNLNSIQNVQDDTKVEELELNIGNESVVSKGELLTNDDTNERLDADENNDVGTEEIEVLNVSSNKGSVSDVNSSPNEDSHIIDNPISAKDFKYQGVIYHDDVRFTYSSSKQSKHRDINNWKLSDDGIYRDSNGYIVVGSQDYELGSIIDTPFGKGIVLDSCDSKNNVNIYTNF